LVEGSRRLGELGDRSFRSTNQALLALVCERLGDRDAALAAIQQSLELGAEEDVVNYAITGGVRARLALADRDPEKAEHWARSGVEYALRTDFLFIQGRAKLELARALVAGGKRDEAIAEARGALELLEAKGDLPSVALARALLEEI
jgi:tetratricopeptide (TPR) repeat protein